MRTLQRYLAGKLIGGWSLVFLVLAAVFGLLGFIQELERVTSNYDAIAVARYTLLTLPQRVLGLAPVIALLGTIVALASMDKTNELTVIRGAGVSLRRFLGAISIPTLALMALLWLSLEFIAAPLHQQGEELRYTLRNGNSGVIPDGGVWAKSGKRYVHLGKMLHGYVPGDINLYEFGDDGELLRTLHASKAIVNPDRRWTFEDVRKKELVDGKLQTTYEPELEIANMWSPQELPTITLTDESMTLTVLYDYSQYLQSNGRSYRQYLSAFWQRLIMPLTVAAMILLATPVSVSLGSGRDTSFGIKMGMGAAAGILFYLGAQVVFALGLLLDLSIPVVSVVPTVIVALCAGILLAKMHW
ncbi:MAG: LPS export ABC transporter permease LptG [Gammaproteobacteria bacterium]|jgi:lipopolysaccharide export system permease protein|nr:LPS export ABC transporter permease LptG [Gammaproteobacteria bacterium]